MRCIKSISINPSDATSNAPFALLELVFCLWAVGGTSQSLLLLPPFSGCPFSSMPGLPSYPSQWLWVCIVFIHVASKILKLCTPSHLQVGILKCFLIHCVRTKQFSEKHKYWQWRSEVNMLSTTHCTKQIKIGFYLLFFLYVKFYLKAIFYISFLLILVLDEPTLVVNMKTIVKLSISQILQKATVKFLYLKKTTFLAIEMIQQINLLLLRPKKQSLILISCQVTGEVPVVLWYTRAVTFGYLHTHICIHAHTHNK